MQTSQRTKGWQQVLKTPLCDLLGVDVPIIQAPMIQAATAGWGAQSAGLIHDLPGAAAIIERVVAEAEAALAGAGTFVAG